MPVNVPDEQRRQDRLRSAYREGEPPLVQEHGTPVSHRGAVGGSIEFVLLVSQVNSYTFIGRKVSITDADSGGYEVGETDETYYAWPWIPSSWYAGLLWPDPDQTPDESATILAAITIGGYKYVLDLPKIHLIAVPVDSTRSGCGA